MQYDIRRKIESEQTWVDRYLKDIEALSIIPFRVLLMIVIIDGFAQYEAGYKTKSNLKCFTDFVEKYGGELQPILGEVCPVTLYYHNHEKYNLGDLNLPEHQILSAGDPVLAKEADRIMKLLPANEQNRYRMRHKYAGLIYALRNKIAHELIYLNQQPNFQQNEEVQIPHIATRAKMGNDNIGVAHLVYDAWTVHIPIPFIEQVIKTTTSNYFEYCNKNSIIPFGKHISERKCMLSWHD